MKKQASKTAKKLYLPRETVAQLDRVGGGVERESLIVQCPYGPPP